MSWADEYAKLRNQNDVEEVEIFYGKNTKKVKPKTSSKKKKKQSFAEEYTELRNQRTPEEKKSIADRVTVTNFKDEYDRLQKQMDNNVDVTARMNIGLPSFDGWFKKSEAGVAKSILGTSSDLFTDLTAGIVGIGEKAVDALAYLAPMAENAQFYQNGVFDLETEKAHKEAVEQSKKGMQKFIEKDLYDEEKVAKKILTGLASSSEMNTKIQNGGIATQEDWDKYHQTKKTVSEYLDNEMEDDSVLDTKSDSLVQSAGQLLGTSAMAALGIPGSATIGVTSFGGEAENAFKEGATYEEAGLSASASALAEVLTEKISGGVKFGGKTMDDAIVKSLARNIPDKAVRTLTKMGVDMVGEGAEEILSGVLGALGQKLTYADEKEFNELFSKEDAWEAFIGGAVLGAGGSAVQAVNASVNGVDAVTELTKNEQKVVDKVYQDRLAEREGKLTEKEKAKIYDQVINDLEKGYISTDTIEDILGDKSEYDSLQKESEEYKTLYETESGKLSERQKDRLAELKEKNRLNPYEKAMETARGKVSDSVFELVKSDKLAESYNERARAKQKFEADLSQYDTKYHAAIQRAIDSGVLNNTNRSHELVDFAAKLEADKGFTIDFTTNQKIKDTGFAVDGKIVNGYKTDSGIAINVQSKKYLQSTVGHEITHVLEGTEFYDTLKSTIIEYAKSKGEYDSRMAELTETYKNIKDADVEAELTADLVGDYLFQDADFVNRLSSENRNLFQKIFDEIKYFCKVVTAGSKEARELEKVKKVFEDAYRAGGKTEGKTEYSLQNVDGIDYVRAESNLFLKEDGTQATEKEVFKSLVGKKIAFPDGVVEIEKGLPGKNMYNELSRRQPNWRVGVDDVKQLNSDVNYNMEELLTNSTVKDSAIPDIGGKHEKQGVVSFDTRTVKFYDGKKAYDIQFAIANLQDGRKVAYAKKFFGYDAKLTKKIQTAEAGSEMSPENQRSVSGTNVPQTGTNVKYSLSDSDGNTLSKEQQVYFKDSKVRDESGKLKAVYHGSPSDFNTFSLKYLGTNGTAEGYGFYFTDKKHIAEGYSRGYEGQQNGESGRLFECYLDIKKPLSDTEVTMTRAQFKKFLTELNNQVDADGEPLDVLSNYGDVEWEGLNKVLNYAMEIEYDGSDSDVNLVHSIINGCGNMEVVFDVLRRTVGYDGIIVNEASWGGDQTIYIAFHPEQIKNTNNLNPTSDPDIRRSLSEKNDTPKKYGNFATLGKDVAFAEDIAPVAENSTPQEETQLPEENSTADNMEAVPETPTTLLADIAKEARRENFRGAYTHNGKQYLSDGSFVAEFNSADESLEQSKDFPIKQATKELDEAFERQAPGNYNLQMTDGEGYVKASNSLFDAKYVNALIREFENPSFAISNMRGGHEALIVTGDNGRAVLMPVRAGDNVNVLYEAQQITDAPTMFPDDIAPETELEQLNQERKALEEQMLAMGESGNFDDFEAVDKRYNEVRERITELEQPEQERVSSIGDKDAPIEEAPFYGEADDVTVDDPFQKRNYFKIGDRKVNAFMYDNPEFQDIFQREANIMLGELQRSSKGKKFYNDALYYITNGEKGWTGQKRTTSESIAELVDGYGMRYEQIQKGLEAILKGGGAENIADAKHIEFMLNDRLMNGYVDFDSGMRVPPNEEYKRIVNQWQTTQNAQQEAETLTDADAPMEEVVPAPVKSTPATAEPAPTLEAPKKDSIHVPKAMEASKAETPAKKPSGKVARILPSEPTERNKFKAWEYVKEHVFDNGMVFEDLGKETGNRALEEKWNFIRNANSMAQRMIGKGNATTKALTDIRKTVQKSGKYEDFEDYMYHRHNVYRMSLAERKFGPNKAVFGETVTSLMSQNVVREYEKSNPEFEEWADDIYKYLNNLRSMMVENGMVAPDTADLWAEMYPDYVPIKRKNPSGGEKKTTRKEKSTFVNAPLHRASGGNSDFADMFDTIAERTVQTYRAIAKNNFGLELMDTIGRTVEHTRATLDDAFASLDAEEALLKKGEKGGNPTFSVFENGQRVEFEITEEMYEALKPRSAAMNYRLPVVSTASELFRKLTTEYNPTFMLTNPIKDVQDIIMNSQHPVRTYAELPRSIWQQVANGKYYQEYVEFGGGDYSFFDAQKNLFEGDSFLDKMNLIGKLNNHIEMTPRLAEYIASREAGKSIEGAMLDAARVTTNFSAGGDIAKFANRNGCTFLNASIQGAVQQVRNVREAHHRGLMGYVGLAARLAVAGLPAVMLNNLMWDDDEEYENLADYAKQNYYIVGKYDDGRFIRIPKGRATAVISDAFEKMDDLRTGDEEADMATFLDMAASNFRLAMENLAPNNPFDNNIVAPLFQVGRNKTWYGEELVPSRLQDLPKVEQFDEKTDSGSIAIAEKVHELTNSKVNISPKQLNYLVNQYSGGVGDFVLPFYTPKAESGDDSVMGKLGAPFRDKFTTDSVLNSQIVTDFRNKQDELKVKSNGKDATQEDMFQSMYMETISYELNDLYAEKREVQTSDLPDSEKYELTRQLQQQINDKMEDALSSYTDIKVSGKYAEVSDRRFNYDSERDTWYQIKEKNADGSENYYYKKEQEACAAFGCKPSDYWNNRDDYDDALYYATSYGKDLRSTVKNVFGVESFAQYGRAMSNLKADYDENGNSISGSKKEKIENFCNELDADYGVKIILFRSQYPKDDTYNRDIVEYLNERSDITYQQMKVILTELGMTVHSDGRVTWD